MTDMASMIINTKIHDLQALSSLRGVIKYLDSIDFLDIGNKVLGINLYYFSLCKCQN